MSGPRREVVEVTIPRDAFLAFCLEQAGRIAVPVTAVHGYTIAVGVGKDDEVVQVLLVVDRPTIKIGDTLTLRGKVKAWQDFGVHEFDFGDAGVTFAVIQVVRGERVGLMAPGYGEQGKDPSTYGSGCLYMAIKDLPTTWARSMNYQSAIIDRK